MPHQAFRKGSVRTSDNLTLVYQYDQSRVNRPTIILLPALVFTKEFFNSLMRDLSRFANVYALDLRCIGESDSGEYSLDRLTQDVVELMEHIGKPRVYLVGHLLGAIVGLNFAATYPSKVIKFVSISGSPFYTSIPGWTYGFVPEVVALFRAMSKAKPADLPAMALQVATLMNPDSHGLNKTLGEYVQYAFSQHAVNLGISGTFDIRTSIDQITAPTLILSGVTDPFAPFGASLFLYEKIANATIIQYAGQASMFPITKYKLFNRDVIDFLFGDADVYDEYVGIMDAMIHAGTSEGNCC